MNIIRKHMAALVVFFDKATMSNAKPSGFGTDYVLRSFKNLILSFIICLTTGLLAFGIIFPAHAGTRTPTPLIIASPYSELVYIYDPASGKYLGSFNGVFTQNDAIAVGDIFGNGLNYVLVAGDETGIIDIFSPLNGQKISSFYGAFTGNDGFAVGDLDGDGKAEVFIAGDVTGAIDIFDPRTGGLIGSFNGGFTINDGFAVGDIDGDGKAEVFIAGDVTGAIDIFDPRTGGLIGSFNGGFTINDGFAVGDIDGDGMLEVFVAGDETGSIDIFNPRTGERISSFQGDFTINDGFAVGDVNGDGKAEVVVFGDVTNIIDIFDPGNGSKIRSFSGGNNFVDARMTLGASFDDTDGDGLLDAWETFGIDTNGDGIADIVLPDADPHRKDIYLHIDYMDCSVSGGDCVSGDNHTHQPKQAAIDAVVQAFASAPVEYPNGSHGITLHVVVSHAIPHQEFLNSGCFTADPGVGDFYAVKNDPNYFGADNPQRFAYHYVVFAHRQHPSTFSSGCGGGSDVLVTLGGWNVGEGDLDGDGFDDEDIGTTMQQAGTLMHELGHNLALPHGGGDDVNYKPNYLSIMNYHYQMIGLIPSGRLDYSQLALPALDEYHLKETLGIGMVSNNTRYHCPDGSIRTGIGSGAIDWNCDNDNETQTDVAVNINGDWNDANFNGVQDSGEDIFETLKGYSDWENIKLGFGNTAMFSAGTVAIPEVSHAEIDYPTFLRIRNKPPVAHAGGNQNLECTGPNGAMVTLDGSQSYDPDRDPLTYTWTGPFGTLSGKIVSAKLSLGTHSITLTVNDGNGAPGTATDTIIVKVQDTTPPKLTLSVSPDTLWPPDHRMVRIDAKISVSDVCDLNPMVFLASINSNEPDNEIGDGNFPNDIQGANIGTDDRAFSLRAERSGKGAGRIYTITYQAKDGSGNTSSINTQVRVPQNKK